MLSAKITGNFNVGGGLRYHTEYKVDVDASGGGWSVYKRYSAFEALHKKVLDLLGQGRVTELGLAFPDKIYAGSLLGTLSSITAQRITDLQLFLDRLLACIAEDRTGAGGGGAGAEGAASAEGAEAVRSSVEVLVEKRVLETFFDFERRGSSGAEVELGRDKILRQAFIRTRVSRRLSALGLWGVEYVVLLRTGYLVLLHSMYDRVTEAWHRIPLAAGQTQVLPKSDNSIQLRSLTDDLIVTLSFPSPADSAYWIRTLADFCATTDFLPGQGAGAGAGAGGDKQYAKKTPPPAPTLTKQVHAQGTGNTEDDLSTLLGI
ncbi:hypothetical protein B484DRAFT_451898 [Ochromonadaceae sp. CCMP2298]|nr:hypothetical protein B484DRAFT_451898 [Ochromonadaceae sp. CCMP2298]